MLNTKVTTSLEPDAAVARLQAQLRTQPSASLPGESAIYGHVTGNRFCARRSASGSRSLRGELTGVVEANGSGSTIQLRPVGADWAAIYTGACLAISVYALVLLRDAAASGPRFLLVVVGACALGIALDGIFSAFEDWRFLTRRLRLMFREGAGPAPPIAKGDPAQGRARL